MSNFDVNYPPSPPWETTQNGHSIQMSESESYQTVIQTQSYVKQSWEVNEKNDFQTTQQVVSVVQSSQQLPPNKKYLKFNYMIEQRNDLEKEPETTSSSQLNFARAGPSKTFIASNAMIGSEKTSGSESQTKLSSSQSSHRMAESEHAFSSSHKHLSQSIEEVNQQQAMIPFNQPKPFSQTNVRYRASSTKLNGKAAKSSLKSSSTYGDKSHYKSSTHGDSIKSFARSNYDQTVTSNGVITSNDSYWPKESYAESTSAYVPGIPNNKFMFHPQQQIENNYNKTPEQLTSVAKSIMLHARKITSPPQAINKIFKSDDVQQSTDNETSKSMLEEGSGIKHSPSPTQADSPQKKLTSAPLCYPATSGNYMSNGQSPMKIPVTAAVDHSYSKLTQSDGVKSIVSYEQSSNQSNYYGAIPLEPHTLTVSNEVAIKSNELIDFAKTPRMESTHIGAFPKNDLPQGTNEEMLKSNDSPNEYITLGENSMIKYSPSHAGSCNQSITLNEKSSKISTDESQIKLQSSQSADDVPADIKNPLITSSDLIPEITMSGQEYQLQLLPFDTQTSPSKENAMSNEFLQQISTSELNSLIELSQPLTAQSYNFDQHSNYPIIFAAADDDFLQYPDFLQDSDQGVMYEVTLPADQPHYQATPSAAIESSTLGSEPLKTTNKVIIQSNVLIEPPKTSVVKSTYALALPKNPRKNPTTSKARPMVNTNRLNLQSKLPRIAGGDNSARTTQTNVDMKPNGSVQQPASTVKYPMKQMAGKVINASINAHDHAIDRSKQKSRVLKTLQQEHKSHPLPKQTNTFDSKSASLKRKLKENISPIVPSKKPLLVHPNELMITKDDMTFSLPDISIEHINIDGGIEKKRIVKRLKLQPSPEIKSNKMTLSDCMETLRRNNVHVFKVPMSPDKVLEKYIKTLEKNDVRVTKIKKK